MKKIFAVIPIAILFILLSHDYNVLASTYTLNPNDYQNVVYITGYNSTWYSGNVPVTIVAGSNYVLSFNNGTTQDNLRSQFHAVNLVNVNIGDFSVESNVGTQASGFNMNHIQSVIVYKGSFDFGNYDTPEQSFDNWQDYQDYINPPLTHWYDGFLDWWDDELQSFEYDVVDPILNIWDWVKSLFVDDPEAEQPNINDIIVSPSPSPTPIPYEVQIRTDPVTNNTSIVYVYNDTNNNTVVSNEPPAPYNPLPVTIGTTLGTGNNSDSGPQYYTNIDPIGLPDLDWLNFDLDFDGNIISTLTGFGSGIETINAGTSEYNSGIEGIFSIFLQIPQDIYFVIGLSLSIILIAGIISRFLS